MTTPLPDSSLSLELFDAALHRIYSVTDPEHFSEMVISLILEITRSQCVGLCMNALLPGDPFITIAVAGRTEKVKHQQYPQDSFLDHPSFRYPAAPAPTEAIRLTDHFATRAELENTRYYQDILRPLGLNYEVTLLMDTPLGQRLGLSVARIHNDFQDHEMELLSRLGPHIQRAFHHAQTLAQFRANEGHAAAWKDVKLTPRESEILRWAATGRTNASIAEILGVGPATVKTHFEHIFVKLGVKNRAAAVAALRHLPVPHRT